MGQTDLNSKLTPAARQALDELVDDYRNQVLLGARNSAARFGDLREISVHDIMAGVGKTQSRLIVDASSKIERLLTLYMWSGLGVGAIGLTGYVLREVIFQKKIEEQIPFLIAVVGFLLGILSYFLLRIRRMQYSKSLLTQRSEERVPDAVAVFVSIWRDLELALRAAASTKLGESVADAPVSQLVRRLAVGGLLSEEESQELTTLVLLRNQVVHGSVEVNTDKIDFAMRNAARILSRLRSIDEAIQKP